MKKTIMTIGLLSFLILGAVNVNAVQATDKKTADFEITENPSGTLLISATALDFGQHTISPAEIVGAATVDSNIKITEFSGNKPGWNLTLTMEPFKDVANNVAGGTRLFFPKVAPTTTTGGDASTKAPTMEESDNSFQGNLKGRIVESNNTPIKIGSAAKGNGFGEWSISYTGANRAQISIPTGQKVGKYTSTLTYTVNDTI